MYLMASLQIVSATTRASFDALASAKAWSRISVAMERSTLEARISSLPIRMHRFLSCIL